MPTYERETRLRAPLDGVWAFHASVEGLCVLTPPWMHLRVESVTGPGDADDLAAGTRIAMSVRPFGVGPRQGWTAEIVARARHGAAAYFRDEMREGPFRRWVHTHTFFADGETTLLRDRVEYATPAGPLGDVAAEPFFEAFFRYRHARTRDALEAP